MKEVVNLLLSQTEEVNNGIGWIVNDLKEVRQLIQLLADSQVLKEDRSIHTMCNIIIEKLEKISGDDVLDINKSITILNNSLNDLIIEHVNKRSTRTVKSSTKQRTRKTTEKKIVKIDSSDSNKDKHVVENEISLKAE